ncbi:MAG TPA: fimbria/pilus outer membrane usher protein [Caulobacteraceae bacterium]|nr:fimbria/pilus outer membrane usher protein [Caulobacteraceae bacterium]
MAGIAAALAMGLAAGTAAAQTAAAPVVVEVRVNGHATDVVLELQADGDRLLATPEQLAQIGLVAPPGEGAVALSGLAGVRYSFHAETQVLEIQAEARALRPGRLGALPEADQGPDPAAWGGLVNYAVYATAGEGSPAQGSAYGEVRLFGPPGLFSSTFVARAGEGGANLRRLTTTLSLVDARRGLRLQAGDFITSGLTWTRPVRAAGLSLTRDFSLRPDLVTQPTPLAAGAAAVPSSVDLYVDGLRRYSGRVDPGPFSIVRPPAVEGRGQVEVVVTDVLGRQTVQSFPFYTASSMLRAGLAVYAVEAGFVRRDFAGPGDGYRQPFAAVSGRRGVSDHLTLEGHAEAAHGLAALGAGLVAKAGEEALISGAFSLSGHEGRVGSQLYLSAQRQTPRYNLFASGRRSFGDFQDLAGRSGDPSPRWQAQAGGSLLLGDWGAVNANYTAAGEPAGSLATAALGWSRRLPVGASLYVNAFAVVRGGGDRGLTIGLTLPLGGGAVGGATAVATGDGRRVSAAASRSPGPDGWGWRASAEAADDGGGVDGVRGDLRHAAGWGEVEAGAAWTGGRGFVRGYAAGAALWLPGSRVELARTVGDSFAVVETGRPGVQIQQENRLIGVTGADGRLVAPGLAAYLPTTFSVGAESVPLSDEIVRPAQRVRPPRGAGMRVQLPVRRARAASVRFVRADGTPPPPGSRVRLDGREAGLIGYDGAAYLTGLAETGRAEVSGAWGRCAAELRYAGTEDPADLGVLVCTAAEPPATEAGLDRERLGLRGAL